MFQGIEGISATWNSCFEECKVLLDGPSEMHSGRKLLRSTLNKHSQAPPSISESRSFENSYIPENPRTPKPLTFSKNRLQGESL
ncbi:hypothetical protein LXL04_035145 [Taraxacum kok-saghyz]